MLRSMVLVAAAAGVSRADGLPSVLVHPIFDRYYTCSEHWDGQFDGVGDALGADCTVVRLVEEAGRAWLRSYAKQGLANEDWFGWQQQVLAPVDGVVVKTNVNPVVNEPGRMGKGRSTFVVLEAGDGVMVLLAHLDQLAVKVGDKVKAGQPIARLGNNGQSRHPHVHVGAWKGKQPLQVRFDQRKLRWGPE
jgi:hypothetical protein